MTMTTPQETSNQRQRRFGAVLGLISAVSALASRLLLVPIMLHYLDSDEFGLYQLVGAFAGYLALVDFGISGTLSRYTAKCQATNDTVRQENVFATCLIIYSILTVIIALIGYALYCNIDTFFSKSLTNKELADVKVMFLILLVSICATVLCKAFIGLSAGYEKFIFSRGIDSMFTLSKVAVVGCVLAMGHRAIAIVVVDAIFNLALLSSNAGYAFLSLKVRIKLHHWDWQLFFELLRFAFWTFVAALVVQANFRIGTVLLGALTVTSLVGIYAIALQVNTLYNTLAVTISSVFLPHITRMVVAKASGEQLTRAVVGPSRYQLMIVGGVLACFILFGRQFITLWAGEAYIRAWIVALVIIIPVTIPICQHTILSILYAKKMNQGRALIALIFAIANTIFSYFLIKKYGLFGPAIATGAALFLGHGIVMNLYYHYWVGLNMPMFYKEVGKGILPVLCLITIVSAFLIYLPVGTKWSGLVVRSVLFFLIYCVAMWLYGMNSSERTFFRTLIQSYLKISSAGFIKGANIG